MKTSAIVVGLLLAVTAWARPPDRSAGTSQSSLGLPLGSTSADAPPTLAASLPPNVPLHSLRGHVVEKEPMRIYVQLDGAIVPFDVSRIEITHVPGLNQQVMVSYEVNGTDNVAYRVTVIPASAVPPPPR